MKGLRISCAALMLAAGAAHAQKPPVKLDDIQISQADGKVSLLVKFTGQPSAASAKAEGDALVIDVDGVALAPFTLDPPAGNLVSHVAAEPSGDGGSLVTLSGAALGSPTAVVYRNAVLIEAVLAEPKLAGAGSLLAGAPKTPPAKPAEPQKAAAEKPAPHKPALETKPAASPPAPAAPKPDPSPNKPISLLPEPKTEPAHPPVAKAEPAAKTVKAASLVGVDAARCTAAKAEFDKNAWAVAALGDHALCLLEAAKYPEAKKALDQLAAFAPDDWRAPYGRAVISAHDGKASEAETGFKSARELAPNETTRESIAAAATALAGLS